MKIALIPNPKRDVGFKLSQEVFEFLSGNGCEIYTPFNEIPGNIIKTKTEAEAIKASDIVLTIGGDGTILHKSLLSSKYNKPLLGINMGKIGYLAEIEPNNMKDLKKLISGDYRIEERLMLKCQVTRNDKTVFSAHCLNECVISHYKRTNYVNFSLYLNDNYLCDYNADATIFATPTGSSAYSLSAGGPLVDPKTDCIIVTPVCPQSIKMARSMIIDGNSTIVSTVSSPFNAVLSPDGDKHFLVKDGDKIVISKSDLKTNLVKLNRNSFYSVFSDKIR